MEVRGKKIVVLGLGKSGLAAASFLAARGGQVTASDAKKEAELGSSLEELRRQGNIDLKLGALQGADLIHEGVDLVVKSPGIPPYITPLLEAKRLGIPVLSEVEVAYAFIEAPIIGITGTNGKTTTTTLIAEMLKEAGERVHLGGNIGIPLLTLALDCRPRDVLVTELSSFQLEDIKEFRPHISVLLNMTADHMDHHGSFEAYLEAKANIFLNQQPGDYAVLNFDDPVVQSLGSRIKGQVVQFSRRETLPAGVFVDRGNIVIAHRDAVQRVIALKDLALPGLHNLENSLAAVAAAHCWGVAPVHMAKVLSSFAGVQHRMEFVAEVGGVKFINDSKGTNTDAAIRALESYKEPIVLIAGGIDKGAGFEEFARIIRKKVAYLILLGETRGKIAGACRDAGFADYILVDSLEDAVRQAYTRARAGDVVLLSPACASWDMFTSFEERGKLFKALVATLGGKENAEKTGE